MTIKRHLRRGAAAMARTMADKEPWTLRNPETDEEVEVTAFLKWKSSEQDPIGKPTKRQKIPIIRALDVPWDEETLIGATITDPDGKTWHILDADTRPSGWTDLFTSIRAY